MNVDGKRLAGQGGVANVLSHEQPPRFHAREHGVAQAASLQLAFHFGLYRRVARRQAAPAVAPGQGAAIGLQRAGQVHGFAVQVGLAVRGAHARAPALAQVVVQCELVRVTVHVQVVAAGVAQVAVARQGTCVAIDLHDASVQWRTDADELGLVVQHRVGAQVPGDGRGHHHLAVVDQAGAAGAVLGRHVQAVGHVGAQRAGAVERGTPIAQGAHLHARLVRCRELGLFGHHIEGAAWFAAAVQGSGGAFEKFHPLDRGHVALRAIAPARRKAVEQAAPIGVAEAANGEVVPGAAKVVEAGDAADKVHRVGQAAGAQVFDELLGHHAHGLGRFQQGRVGAGGGGVALRALVAAAARGFAHLHFRQGGAVRVRAVCILGEHARGAQQGAQRQRGARHGGMPAGAGDGNLHGQEKRRATGKRCGDTAVPTVAGPHERGQWLKRGAHGCMRPPPLSMQMQTILI